jgi:hypothetical protein
VPLLLLFCSCTPVQYPGLVSATCLAEDMLARLLLAGSLGTVVQLLPLPSLSVSGLIAWWDLHTNDKHGLGSRSLTYFNYDIAFLHEFIILSQYALGSVT